MRATVNSSKNCPIIQRLIYFLFVTQSDFLTVYELQTNIMKCNIFFRSLTCFFLGFRPNVPIFQECGYFQELALTCFFLGTRPRKVSGTNQSERAPTTIPLITTATVTIHPWGEEGHSPGTGGNAQFSLVVLLLS